jgi:hypothetical protein
MAGVGILFAYLFYGAVGLVAATVCSVVLVLWGGKALPDATKGRTRFLWACACWPFLGWLWVLFSWIAYSYILDVVFDRDNGMSTVRYAPTPKGYTVGSVSYAFGYLLGPGEPPVTSYAKDGPNSVAAITFLQESEPYLLGSKFISESGIQAAWTSNKKYFLVDTRSHNILRFDTMDELKSAAMERGIAVKFEEGWTGWCWDAYSKYRPIWFDWFFPICSIAGLVALIASLVAKTVRLRRRISAEST